MYFITKPAVAVIQGELPNIYFGTGADDRAPDDELYRFYSVQDGDARGTCLSYNGGDATTSQNIKHDEDLHFGSGVNGNYEWIVGDGCANTKGNTGDECTPIDLEVNEGVTGERYWSDPVIVGNQLIYFASLYGKIDQVDPELNTAGPNENAGPSKLYCYWIRGKDALTPAGSSCWKDDQGKEKAWEEAFAKVRQGLTVTGDKSGTWARNQASTETDKGQIFFQRFSDTTREGPALMHEGTSVSGNICIVHWREVPL